MTRNSMAALILKVRQETHAGTADHNVAGVSYWTDDQIQSELDRCRYHIKQLSLEPLQDYIAGAASYTEYPIPPQHQWLEGTADDGGWALRESDGTDAPAYTADLNANIITFDADTGGTVYELTARGYDLYATVANIWQQKAGFYESKVDWSSDNHRVAASQQADFARKKAEEYRRMGSSSISYSTLVRTDEASWS